MMLHLPPEILERIFLYSSSCDVIKWKNLVSNYVYLCKKDANLRQAIDNDNLIGVKYLLEMGADIHANDNYALRFSAENGRLEIVKYLVEMGADIRMDDEYTFRFSAEHVLSKNEFYLNKSCIKYKRR